jgi:hypothetical protein
MMKDDGSEFVERGCSWEPTGAFQYTRTRENDHYNNPKFMFADETNERCFD